MRLSPTAFNRHLNHIGQAVTWRAAFACPCRNQTSGAADTKCQYCGGKGQQWVAAKPTTCGVSSQQTQAKWAASGRWVDGDIVVTIPGASAMWEMGQFDRVIMLNAPERFSTTLVHGHVTERLLHAVKDIERVFWLSPSKVIVEGSVPKFDAQGLLTWPGGTGAPPAGVAYSITGHRYAEYYCFDNMVKSRSEHSGARLPKHAVLRRWDLWGRSPNL